MTSKAPKEERMQTIIDAAVDEFVEKGYDAASVDSIARRARLTKGGVYHHFASKDDILIAANAALMAQVLELMEQARASRDPVAALRTYIRATLSHWSEHPEALAFTFLSLTKTLSKPNLLPQLETYADLMVSFFRGLLDAGVKVGSLRPHDTESRATALFAALDGITPYLVSCKRFDVKTVARRFERAFLNDVLRKARPGVAGGEA